MRESALQVGPYLIYLSLHCLHEGFRDRSIVSLVARMHELCVSSCHMFMLIVFFQVDMIMAQANRWTLKILSLPVFDDAFAQAVLASPLGDIAFVVAMNATSASNFAQKVFQLSGSFEVIVAEALLKDASRLEQFWFLAVASEKLFLESTAFQLGSLRLQKL